MRINTEDLTLKRNYLQKYRFLIKEYELVKSGRHPRFRFVNDFYSFHHTDRRSFLKYYGRYKQSGREEDLLPRKRGPKFKTRRTIPFIEQKILELRALGNGRYEIHRMLKGRLKGYTPTPSTIYNIFRRHGLNRLRPKEKAERRRIISKKAGELGHIDTHHLSKDIIIGQHKKLYLVCVVDGCSRAAWAETVEDTKSLTVMFSVLRCINILREEFGIKFEGVLTDNGAEFGTRNSTSKEDHPFERMLMELGIKHRYTRPYRPQTNGKAERFWRTLNYDLIEDTTFDSEEEFKNLLLEYLVYYNHERPHQSLGGIPPAEFLKSCPRIT
jgi:hypothetical protein